MTLALLAKVSELVVAIDATQIYQIHHSSDLPARQLEANLYSLELDQRTIPGWDLGELFGYGPATTAWVVVDAQLGTEKRRFGLRVGACITVRKVGVMKPLPSMLYPARPGCLSGAFSTEGMSELPDTPSGVMMNLSNLLTPVELEAGVRIAREYREARD